MKENKKAHGYRLKKKFLCQLKLLRLITGYKYKHITLGMEKIIYYNLNIPTHNLFLFFSIPAFHTKWNHFSPVTYI